VTRKPIFFDPTGKRGKLLLRLSWAVGTVAAIVMVLFGATLAIAHRPGLAPDSTLKTSIRCAWAPTCSPIHPLTTANTPGADPELLRSPNRLAADLRDKERALRAKHSELEAAQRRPLPPDLADPAERALSIGFYANWDDNSYPALKRALPHLDWVIPDWLKLEGDDMALKPDVDVKVLNYIQAAKPNVAILPMIQNAVDGAWQGDKLAKMLADPAARGARVAAILAFLQENKFKGVTVDFEEVPPKAQKNLKLFLDELEQSLSSHGYIVVLAVPFDDPAWPYATYAKIADFLLLMAYDQHWEEGAPGSIAGQSWYENLLDKRMKVLDPERTIVAIGGYGYDWVKGQAAQDLTFEEAVLSARDSETDIDFDLESGNPHFAFVEDDGKRHDVWFLDGVTAFNEVHAADVYQPAGYALWRIGAEDPSVWSVLGRPYDAPAPDGLRTIGTSEDIDFEGEGEILRVAERPAPGTRTIEIDPDTGDVDDQTYTSIPTPYVIQRTGAKPHELALTFDDGPDPLWTPQILDILKAKGVHASFFVIGENAEAAPDLVQRIVAEGHDVGNHTFTHPNLGELPPSLVTLEINATQRLFEALTGRSMRLFRAPYFGDAEPTTSDEISPIETAQSMGYLSVGLHVDPDDWLRPKPEEIVSRVISQVNDPNPDIRGHIILLHDSGGDRSSTIAALPQLIDSLRAQGFSFVTVSQLAGLTRDQVMPAVPAKSLGRLVGLPVFTMIGWTGHLFTALFIAAIWLGLLRLVFLCAVAAYNRGTEARSAPPRLPASPALQSVLIPAHNEAKVIAQTIRHVLSSDYPALEVLVIDDGSGDGTGEAVRARFAADDRVRLIAVPNGGKAAALNRGLAEAQGAVAIALDADTHFERDAISKLVRWFEDPQVAAVAGNAKVGNRINLLTRWQALEYITSQNLERRALATLGCITVVPGAIGAWRREVVLRLGGFPLDTLAEDQDLTIGLLKAGHKVLYDSTAIAWTEAPDAIGGLIKQRFRWCFGTLQCLWKHRRVTFRPRYRSLGLFAVPQTWLFQFLFAVIAPFVDLMLIWRLAASSVDYFQHAGQFDAATLQKIGLFYLLFQLVDLGCAVLALVLERKERWTLAPWLVLQRFGYRQFMYYVVVKALVSAALGPVVAWGKLERKSTVAATA
jgi:cellulose synthase/poly-beta-1,6-N-acetylglucosamine synthase-like glycosyltransferase/peptidoglycan/xylan/chitin deacetylase (PgdA/CDA1 family)/spore germination protein YaaH